MTKDNWIKAFKNKFEKVVERFDDGSYITEGVNPEMIDFISQVEKDAIEKTNKRWREKLNAIADGAVGLTKDTSGNDREYLWYDDVQKVISDLLEEKK